MTEFFYVKAVPCRISMSPRDPDDYPVERKQDENELYDLAQQTELEDARDVLREQAELRAADECCDISSSNDS